MNHMYMWKHTYESCVHVEAVKWHVRMWLTDQQSFRPSVISVMYINDISDGIEPDTD